jgi:hypothetical protein
MILLFKVFVFRSRESMNKKRSVFRIKKKVKVKMIRDYRCRGGSDMGKEFVEEL